MLKSAIDNINIWAINMLIYKVNFWVIRKLNIKFPMGMRYVTNEVNNLRITHGLNNNDLSPKRCKCGAKQEAFYDRDKYYENDHLVEFATNCGECGKTLGRWSYGKWYPYGDYLY